MFKKHVFTCPDTIYLRNRAKRNNRIAMGVNVVIFGALWAYAWHSERKIENAIDEHENTNP